MLHRFPDRHTRTIARPRPSRRRGHAGGRTNCRLSHDLHRIRSGIAPYSVLAAEMSDQVALEADSGTVATPPVVTALTSMFYATVCPTAAPGRSTGRSVANLTVIPPNYPISCA